MTHCVYNSLVRHLEYLGKETTDVWSIYQAVRQSAAQKENESTFVGIVPTIAMLVAKRYNLFCQIEQSPDFDFRAMASKQELPYSHTGFPPVTNGPGVYCSFIGQHCEFYTERPNGYWVMSIKLRR